MLTSYFKHDRVIETKNILCFFFKRKIKIFFGILEYILSKSTDSTPIRRSRSISQSFKNLFRSNSKKKGNAAKTDALGEFENGKKIFYSLINQKEKIR
jgi:hypothetical protein